MKLLNQPRSQTNRYYPAIFWVVSVLFVFVCASVFVYLFRVVLEIPLSQTFDEVLTRKIFDLVVKSLFLAFAVSILASVFGLVFSWLVERTDLKFKKTWNISIEFAMAMPSYVLAYAWLEKYEAFASMSGAIFILTLVTIPFAYINMRIAIKRLDVQLEEVANSLGSSDFDTFVGIVFPQLRKAFFAGMLICFLYVITDFGAVSTLRVEVFTWVIYGAYRAGFSPERAAILSVLLFLIALAVVVFEGFVSSNRKESELNKVQLVAKPAKLGVVNLFGQLAIGSYIGLTLAFPIIRSINWTFEYKSSFSFQDFKQPIINTLGVGTVTALFATFVGTRVVAGIYLEWPLVIIALCVSFGYLAITPIKNSLDRKNKTLLDVSSSLGRGNYFTLTKVTIPLSSNGLKAAAILVFVAAIKELPITLLLRPNEQNTLATYLWSNLGVSKFAVVAPSMLLLIFISAVPLMFLIKGKYD